MKPELKAKILKLAIQIVWEHGSIAGYRICQDWSMTTENIEALTDEEKLLLNKNYEDYNSEGRDFDPEYAADTFGDEMMVSFMVARALEMMVENY